MELLFRRYFWTVQLAFVLAAALLCAKITNLFIEGAIAPASVRSTPMVATRSSAPQAERQLTLEGLARITGLPIPNEPTVVEPTQTQIDENAAPVKSDLRAQLLGTLVAGSVEWSFASILDLTTQRSGTYRVGDKLLGAELLDIQRTRVIVRNNGRKEYISNEPGDAPAQVAVAGTPPPSNGLGIGAGVRATGENTYEVPRNDIDKALTNLNDLAMQARIVPAFKDGVAQGFKLFSIRPDSLYSKIGIVNGDVIRRINGFDMNSPEKALEVYSRLKDANRIDIELERNGSPLRKQYTIR